MRTKLTIMIMMVSLLSWSQSKEELFKVSKEGFTDYVVVKIDSFSQKELFDKTINWIKETYNSPDDVIKARIDSSKVIFEGFKPNALYFRALGMKKFEDVKYRIAISFKNGRYKFEALRLQIYASPSQYSSGGWSDWNLDGTYAAVTKKNGKVRKSLRDYIPSIERVFNQVLLSHKLYMTKQEAKQVTKKEEDW